MAPFLFKRAHVDVKQYYRKIREVQNALPESDVLVVSLATADGGKEGVISETSREVAAKLIVEGRAVQATEEQKTAYFERQIAARKEAHRAELARRLQVAIIAEPDMELRANRNSDNWLDKD